jgi:hypothetical protein
VVDDHQPQLHTSSRNRDVATPVLQRRALDLLPRWEEHAADYDTVSF